MKFDKILVPLDGSVLAEAALWRAVEIANGGTLSLLRAAEAHTLPGADPVDAQVDVVREAEEYFAEGQKGSSAMPHKRNPVTSEQICGLARVVRANAQAAFEDIALWHERDISHSSVERVILPDSTILTDYLLHRTTQLVSKLLVYPDRMRRNLELTRGLVFSGQLLLDLAAAGMLREKAYKLVQEHAMRAWAEESDFRAVIERDPEIVAALGAAAIARCFSLDRQLRNVDKIFARVFP